MAARTCAGTLVATLVLSAAILFLPSDTRADARISTAVSYQSNEQTAGGTTNSTTQERFMALMTVNSRISTKLSMNARLGFDIVKRKTGNAETEDMQPDLEIRFSTNSVLLTTGYRQSQRDSTTVTATGTTQQSSDTTELVLDTDIRAGKLPNMRLKYFLRDQMETGATTIDTSNSDLRGSMNYRLGVFALNADYAKLNTTNNITGNETEKVQLNGQLLITKRFSPKVNTSLRENYLISQDTRTGAPKVTKVASTSEARLNLNPVKRSALNASYIYRTQSDKAQDPVQTTTNELDERRWFTNASYSFPKMLRFYGSYSNRVAKTEQDSNILPPWFSPLKTGRVTTDVTTYGFNFKHRISKFNISTRYERRISDNVNVVNNMGVTTITDDSSTRDNLDWIVDSSLTGYLKLALSESYVINATDTATNEDNRFRLKVDIGPIKNLSLNPYVDYTIATRKPANGQTAETTTTEMVIPVKYLLEVGKLKFDFTDNYRTRTTDTNGSTSKSSTNNALVRLTIHELTKSLSLAADASFTSSTTDTTSTSSSAYTARLMWAMRPHRFGATVSYQTGEGRPSTTGYGLQYALSLRMRKIAMAMQATYNYTSTAAFGSSQGSSGQTIYLSLTLRN